MGEIRCRHRVLTGKMRKRDHLEKPRRRWEDNIKMDVRKVGWGAWTGLIWLRIRKSHFVIAVTNLRVQ
jgi:hypothetical protein